MLFQIIRLACFGLLSIYINQLFATTFPRGCEVTGFGYQNNYLVINPDGQQAYFLIQNRSNQTIQLQRYETRDVFMSPKLETNLASTYWAAFASDEPNMYFKCLINTESKTSLVSCSEVLEVCRYPRARFALSNMGNYWVSTNKPQNLVIKESIAKGIYLKW